MKKNNLFVVLLMSTSVGFGVTSCNKCVECTTELGGGLSVSDVECKPENYTTKAWNKYLEEIEDDNTTCENL